jgi:hypothetical protein
MSGKAENGKKAQFTREQMRISSRFPTPNGAARAFFNRLLERRLRRTASAAVTFSAPWQKHTQRSYKVVIEREPLIWRRQALSAPRQDAVAGDDHGSVTRICAHRALSCMDHESCARRGA